MAELSSTRVFGKLTVMHDAILKANAEITGTATAAAFVGDGSGLTALDATAIATGTVPDARLPTTATRWPAWGEVTSKPNFAAVATSGAYSDLSGVPVNATPTVAGLMAAADKSKLDGIESGATADQTKADIDALGIDADTVDGVQADQLVRGDNTGAAKEVANGLRITNGGHTGDAGNDYGVIIEAFEPAVSLIDASTDAWSGQVAFLGDRFYFRSQQANDGTIGHNGSGTTVVLELGELNFSYMGNTVWHSGNDGDGSGLDADTVDGAEASDLRDRATHTGTQPLSTISDAGTAAGMDLPAAAGNAGKVLRQKSDETGIEYTADPYTYDVNDDITTKGDLTVAGVLTETSSIKYKENLRDLDNALASVLRLSGVMYDRGPEKKDNSGFIAEDVEQVIPNVVTYKDGEVEGIKYTQLIAYLVEAIKSLNDKIAVLEGWYNDGGT